MEKKGQLKMLETVIILIVLVILFAIILIIYGRFQLFEVEEISKEVEEQRAASLLNKIIGMPELRCSLSFGSTSETNCLDSYKLLAFTQLRDEFKDNFEGLSEVKIIRHYPAPDNKQECVFSNDYPLNCGQWTLFDEKQSRESIDTFVTICTQKEVALYECEVGRLIVGVPER